MSGINHTPAILPAPNQGRSAPRCQNVGLFGTRAAPIPRASGSTLDRSSAATLHAETEALALSHCDQVADPQDLAGAKLRAKCMFPGGKFRVVLGSHNWLQPPVNAECPMAQRSTARNLWPGRNLAPGAFSPVGHRRTFPDTAGVMPAPDHSIAKEPPPRADRARDGLHK
jgi:hypothetical protein